MNEFVCETNPTWLRLQDKLCLVNSGQPLTDMCKYMPIQSITRIEIAASTLTWRHQAPTAPDTLWCYPYFTADPFIIPATPDLYVVGNQPSFETKIVSDLFCGETGGELIELELCSASASTCILPSKPNGIPDRQSYKRTTEDGTVENKPGTGSAPGGKTERVANSESQFRGLASCKKS